MAESTESHVVVLCTVPTPEVGAEIGRGLVEGKLAACVNIVPGLRSIYVWDGETKDDSECQLLIKTRQGRFDALASWIRAHHPYSEPEILALPILAGSSSYLAWISAQTQDG